MQISESRQFPPFHFQAAVLFYVKEAVAMDIRQLSEKPFYLNEAERKWVSDTLDHMTARDKCGQLFVVLGNANTEAGLRDLIENWGVGGVLFRPGPRDTVAKQYQRADGYARIPLLKAANLEEGGAGVVSDGTYFGNALQVAASDDLACTEAFAKCCAKEGRSVGVNWTYSPAGRHHLVRGDEPRAQVNIVLTKRIMRGQVESFNRGELNEADRHRRIVSRVVRNRG